MKPRVRRLPQTGDGITYRVEFDGRVTHARAHTADVLRLGQVRADWLEVTRAALRFIREPRPTFDTYAVVGGCHRGCDCGACPESTSKAGEAHAAPPRFGPRNELAV